jgi:hypothetical protein
LLASGRGHQPSANPRPMRRHPTPGGIRSLRTPSPLASLGYQSNSVGYPRFPGTCFASNVCAAFASLRFKRPMLCGSMARTPCGKKLGCGCWTTLASTAPDAMRKMAVGRVGIVDGATAGHGRLGGIFEGIKSKRFPKAAFYAGFLPYFESSPGSQSNQPLLPKSPNPPDAPCLRCVCKRVAARPRRGIEPVKARAYRVCGDTERCHAGTR